MSNETFSPELLPAPKRPRKRTLRIIEGGGTRYPTPRRFHLNSLLGVRKEMAGVYRLAREGRMPLADACKYAFILGNLAKIITDADLELRLQRIEDSVNRGFKHEQN